MRFKTCDICKKLFNDSFISTKRVNHKKTQVCNKCVELANLRSSKNLTPQEEIKLALNEGKINIRKK